MLWNKCGKNKGRAIYKQISVQNFFLVTYFRYHEVFFMIDTCQAASMYERFYSPNILSVGSSMVGEDSLSVNSLYLCKFVLYNNILSFLASRGSSYWSIHY